MIVAGVTPGPAERAVEHVELGAGLEVRDRLGALVPAGEQRRGFREVAQQRRGVMRGDHPAGERDVGEVLAIGVGGGVGQVGAPG